MRRRIAIGLAPARVAFVWMGRRLAVAGRWSERFLLAPAAMAAPALAMGMAALAFAQLWRFAPDGGLRLWRFSALALILIAGPGLGIRRLTAFASARALDHVLMVGLTGLASTVWILFTLYQLGVYTRPALLAWTAVSAFGLAWGRPRIRVTTVWLRYARWIRKRSVVEKIAWMLAIGFLCEQTAAALGNPFLHWDAVVSWDKWACDMAGRHALGRYLMGGYPQALPTWHSLFYKAAGSWGEGYAAEQLLLRPLMILFPVMAMLGLIRWIEALRLRWGGAVLLLMACNLFSPWMLTGYADWALLGMMSAGGALMVGHVRPLGWRCRRGGWAGIGVMGLGLYAVGFFKGQGLVLMPLLAMIAASSARSTGWLETGRRKGLSRALLLGLLLVAPFYLHQVAVDRLGLADPDPRLHSFSLAAGYPQRHRVDARAAVKAYAHAFEPATRDAAALMTRMGVDRARPWVVLVFMGTAFLIGMRDKRMRGVGLAAAIMIAGWQWRSAYDWRNVMPAHLFLALLAAPAMSGLERAGKGWTRIPAGMILILLFGGVAVDIFRQTPLLAELATRDKYVFWSHPDDRRLAVADPRLDRLRSWIRQSAVGRRAAHVYVNDPFYRHLDGKGVYTWKAFSFSRQTPGDVFLFKRQAPPAAFVPVAIASGIYNGIAIEGLSPDPAQWRVLASAADADGIGAHPDPTAGLLVIKALPDLQRHDVLIVRIELPAGGSVTLDPEWDVFTGHRDFFLPYADGHRVTLMVWMDRGGRAAGPAPPLRVEGTPVDVRLAIFNGAAAPRRRDHDPGLPGRPGPAPRQ